MTFRVTVQIHFCYGHRLLDYDGACAHPHGHNGLVEIEHIVDVTSRFIVNRAALKTRPERVTHWIERFRDVAQAA